MMEHGPYTLKREEPDYALSNPHSVTNPATYTGNAHILLPKEQYMGVSSNIAV